MTELKIKQKKNLQDLTGITFGELTVIAEAERRRQPSGITKRYWTCRCSCGKIKEVYGSQLKNSNTKSCGHVGADRLRGKMGAESQNWKGGRRIDDGYVLIYIPTHHKAKSNGYVREHIVVMEKELGRKLVKGENVHHKNGNKQDNRPENLELWSTSQPAGQRVEDKLAWAREIIKLYEK